MDIRSKFLPGRGAQVPGKVVFAQTALDHGIFTGLSLCLSRGQGDTRFLIAS